MLIWKLILGFLTSAVTPIFEFLNKRVESAERIHINDNATMATIVGGTQSAISNADGLNTQVRLKEGPWSPWVVVTIAGFMVPLAIHTWQVVIDSSKWLVRLGPYYLPQIYQARETVAALPGMFEITEHAVIQSLFVGAGAAVGAIPIIMALRGRR